jgi:hypothetical protein
VRRRDNDATKRHVAVGDQLHSDGQLGVLERDRKRRPRPRRAFEQRSIETLPILQQAPADVPYPDDHLIDGSFGVDHACQEKAVACRRGGGDHSGEHGQQCQGAWAHVSSSRFTS